MSDPLSQRSFRILCGLVALLVAATAFAQEPLTKAKALYDAANYEEALTVLASVLLLALGTGLARTGLDMVWCLAVVALAPWLTVVTQRHRATSR